MVRTPSFHCRGYGFRSLVVPLCGVAKKKKNGKWNRIESHAVNPHAAAVAKSLQLCLTLYDPIDGSPPGFPVPGILQARTLEWVAISFSNA